LVCVALCKITCAWNWLVKLTFFT